MLTLGSMFRASVSSGSGIAGGGADCCGGHAGGSGGELMDWVGGRWPGISLEGDVGLGDD